MEIKEIEKRVGELLQEYYESNNKIEKTKENLSYTEQFMLTENQDFIKAYKIEKELQQIYDDVNVEIQKLKEEKEIITKSIEEKIEGMNYTDVYLLSEEQSNISLIDRKLNKYNDIQNSIKNLKIEKNGLRKEINSTEKNIYSTKEEINSIINNDNNLKILYDRKENKYFIKDDLNNYNQEFRANTSLFKYKNRRDFVDELEKSYNREFKFAVDESIDVNLYNCLKEYDNIMGTNKADNYIKSLDSENYKCDFEMTYNMKGKSKLGFLDNIRMNKIAKINEKYGIAQIEKDSLKEKFKRSWKKVIAVVTAGALAKASVVGYLDKGKTDNIKQNTIEHSENSTKETNEQNNFKDSLKVGLKGTINQGIYYADSEKNGPIGSFENHKGEELKVDNIAILDKETGKIIRTVSKDEIEKLNIDNNQYAMYHISHNNGECEITGAGALGWTDKSTAEKMLEDDEPSK